MKLLHLIIWVCLFVMSSCGTSKKYKALQSELEDIKISLQKCREKLADCEQEKADVVYKYNSLGAEIGAKNSRISDLEAQLEFLRKSNNNLLDRLADFSVVTKEGAANIKKSLEALNEKDKYIKDLTTSLARKDSLNLALVMNLKRSLAGESSDDIKIEVKKGVVYISLSDNMLFRTASAVINDRALAVLEKIAKVVNDHSELDILVEGHTDNVPISNECMLDNWDLSAKRATSVARTLTKKFNVNPARITAGGRSEFIPKADNATSEGRKLNRRTEIIILPKLDQFFELVASQK